MEDWCAPVHDPATDNLDKSSARTRQTAQHTVCRCIRDFGFWSKQANSEAVKDIELASIASALKKHQL
jgi:hypothetical protein